MLLNLFGLAAAIYCGLSCGDRLRQINFRNSRPLYVLMYVAFVCWSIGVASDAWGASLDWYQLIGLFACICLLRLSKENWRNGPPASATRPAPLGGLEPRIFTETHSP